FAQGGTRVILAFMRLRENPVSFNVAPDARVLLFTTAAALFSGLLFGLGPALRSSRIDLASLLKGTASSVAGNALMQRLNHGLVVVQVALSLVLLVGAGLFVRTLEKLKGLDAGFNRENVVLFDLDFTRKLDPTRCAALYNELLARLEALPGVRAASFSTFYLLSGGSWMQRVIAEGYTPVPGEDIYCHGLKVSPRFFETMGTPVLSGRDFGPQDQPPVGSPKSNSPRTVLINETLAKRYFGNANPVKYRSLRDPAPPTFYLSSFQEPGDSDEGMTFTVRTAGTAGVLAGSIRSVLNEVDQTVQMRDLRMMNDVINGSIHRERVLAQLGGFFSVLALALACLGLYGVLSLTVVQRTREIGVRLALGARRTDLLSLVIGKGLKLVLCGSVIGLAGALAATRLVSSLLYGVSATDPLTFAGVSLLLVSIAVLGSWLPARRATKVDPMEALRYE
ncbi:MAG: multidrug ABC transporter substrate-binding protein, partial [Verrucomicrobia bacterium]